MAIRFSGAAQKALGETWHRLLSAKPGNCSLEFYSGTMPKSPDTPVPTERLLARLPMDTRTMEVASTKALRSGEARWCRLVASNGAPVADFDLSLKGGGTLEFNTLGLRKDGPVSLFGALDFFGAPPQDEQGRFYHPPFSQTGRTAAFAASRSGKPRARGTGRTSSVV